VAGAEPERLLGRAGIDGRRVDGRPVAGRAVVMVAGRAVVMNVAVRLR